MPYADKQKANEYKKDYDKAHYKGIYLKMLPEDADLLAAAATEAGQSNAQYVLQAVRERIARDTAQD